MGFPSSKPLARFTTRISLNNKVGLLLWLQPFGRLNIAKAHSSRFELAMSVAVVTGANRINGIGYEIARGLARRLPEGSSVVLTTRTPELGQKAMESLKTEVGERVKANLNMAVSRYFNSAEGC